jgi:hypothetical protein
MKELQAVLRRILYVAPGKVFVPEGAMAPNFLYIVPGMSNL